ncbi:acetyltransferase, partial [Vibrio cholerae]|nr:acetyltransferase [Vibrio cholerae]
LCLSLVVMRCQPLRRALNAQCEIDQCRMFSFKLNCCFIENIE